jgi:hypothetical protein
MILSREPIMRIYDARFKYTPSTSTNIVSTWKRFGFKPTTESERLARQRWAMRDDASDGSIASIAQLDSAKRKARGPLRLAKKSAVSE